MSRTVVKPRSSVASACRAANSCRYAGSPVRRAICGVAAMNACQCASIRPGISTRPSAAMTRTSAALSTAIGSAAMRSIVLPLTNTLEGAERAAPLPSKIRTFWNSVAAPPARLVGKAGDSGASRAASPCPRLARQSPTRSTTAKTDGRTIVRPHDRPESMQRTPVPEALPSGGAFLGEAVELRGRGLEGAREQVDRLVAVGLGDAQAAARTAAPRC